MTKRIDTVFSQLREKNRAALIPFIMGFDGGAAATLGMLASLPAAGADIIEIGIPFSDPMADGPTIQAAGLRALSAGATLAGVLGIVREFRTKNVTTPIILMGYYNPIYRYGADKFCADAAASGVDGVIIVDLPPEEENELKPQLYTNGVDFIRLISPTSGVNDADGGRLPMLSKSASGFVYYISITGITGTASAQNSDLEKQVKKLREYTDLPVAVGFGIKNAAQVADVAKFADAVVVGSALVDVFAKNGKDAALGFIRELAQGVKR
ncbi:MAG: tryptophan synthase subunit alpha [Alphaproteobacteria bacterium]|nr:tryptophan synthase subunit alpha [Alphaproteobacteria bacterium]